jgi:F0F1-type ATP synthase membrane subunit b/b'
MDTWVWIVIAVVVALVILGALFAMMTVRGRRLEDRRTEASALRGRARIREQKAERRQELADEQADEARREREAAEATRQRADDVDPDADADADKSR